MTAVLVACLVGCAVVLVWPGARVLGRLSGGRPAFRLGDLRRLRVPVASLGRRGVFGFAGLAGVGGLLVGGPVAGVIAGVYGGLGTAEWVRRAGRKRVAAGRAAALDGLSALVADLRAGLPPTMVAAAGGSSFAAAGGSSFAAAGGSSFAAAGGIEGDRRIAGLAGAVWRLAEQTGAPAADLLERIEADARATDRAAASAGAQAAGAQATALLLAALPVGGIALGFSIGADPIQVLLRTPLGAACAIGALVLQCGGLLWARRLVEGPS